MQAYYILAARSFRSSRHLMNNGEGESEEGEDEEERPGSAETLWDWNPIAHPFPHGMQPLITKFTIHIQIGVGRDVYHHHHHERAKLLDRRKLSAYAARATHDTSSKAERGKK